MFYYKMFKNIVDPFTGIKYNVNSENIFTNS